MNTEEINQAIKRGKQNRTVNTKAISDTHHTFEDLYYHRMVLFALFVNAHPDISQKSWHHADGKMFDGDFIVGINTPDGQYSYHYKAKFWNRFKVPELKKAPKYDGHTPNDINRLFSVQKGNLIMNSTLEHVFKNIFPKGIRTFNYQNYAQTNYFDQSGKQLMYYMSIFAIFTVIMFGLFLIQQNKSKKTPSYLKLKLTWKTFTVLGVILISASIFYDISYQNYHKYDRFKTEKVRAAYQDEQNQIQSHKNEKYAQQLIHMNDEVHHQGNPDESNF